MSCLQVRKRFEDALQVEGLCLPALNRLGAYHALSPLHDDAPNVQMGTPTAFEHGGIEVCAAIATLRTAGVLPALDQVQRYA